jgi:hypothetical protein
MSPILQEALGSIVRHFLTIGASFLVTRGIWTDQDAVTYVAAAAMGIVGLGWALWQKSQANTLLEKALVMPAGSTVAQAKREVAKEAKQ